VQAADRPLAAAEMVLVRIAYAADLPTPDEVVRSLDEGQSLARPQGNGGAAAPARGEPANAQAKGMRSGARTDASRSAPRAALAPMIEPGDSPAPDTKTLVIGRFEELIAFAANKRDLVIKAALERDVRPVRCEDGRLEIALEPSAAKSLVGDLSRKLGQWTGRRWMVVVSGESGAPTLKAQNDARQAALRESVRADPLVEAVLARFPGAEIVGVSRPQASLDAGPDVAAAPRSDTDADDIGEPPVDDDSSAFGTLGRPDDVDDDL
jgi:DNA polymerase-3 subunit gamma/tau